MKPITVLFCTSLILFAACTPKTSKETMNASKSTEEVISANPVETVDGVTTVRIEGNDRMQFSLTEFTVKSGDTVRIIFLNKGRMPKTAMGHNVVILKSDADANAYAGKAAMARDNEFIPASEAASVIAHTKLLGPDESDTIEFTAPAAGEYEYICTFPAHCFTGMRGVMRVVAE
ncbi:MAG: plastocyanin/azurin family copper-binding protein [Opitutaceae bacterium]